MIEYLGILLKPKMILAAVSNWVWISLLGLFIVAASFAYQAVDGLTLPRVNDHLNVVDQRDLQAIRDLRDGEREAEISRQTHFEALSSRLEDIHEKQISTDDELHWILAGGSLAITLAGLLIGAGAWKIRDRGRGNPSYPVYLSQPSEDKLTQLELYQESLRDLIAREREIKRTDGRQR